MLFYNTAYVVCTWLERIISSCHLLTNISISAIICLMKRDHLELVHSRQENDVYHDEPIELGVPRVMKRVLVGGVAVIAALGLSSKAGLFSVDTNEREFVCGDKTMTVLPGQNGVPPTAWEISDEMVAGGNTNPDAVVEEIARINPGISPSVLSPGVTIKIPVACSYQSAS